jgi:recombination protein RecT
MSEATAVSPRAETAPHVQPHLPAPLLKELRLSMPSCKRLLPPDVPEDKFRAALMIHLMSSKKLQDATLPSLMGCVIKAASDGLLPGVDCYFLPFKNKGVTTASYVCHYQGIVRILERSGKLARAFAHPVYEGDEFWIDYFQTPPASHKPALGAKRGAIRCYYGAIVQKDGAMHVEPMTLDEIEAIRKKSPGGEQDAWLHFPVMMARKTALKRVSKYVQLTAEQQRAIEEDDSRSPAAPTDAQAKALIVDMFGDRPPAYNPPTQACGPLVDGEHETSRSVDVETEEETDDTAEDTLESRATEAAHDAAGAEGLPADRVILLNRCYRWCHDHGIPQVDFREDVERYWGSPPGRLAPAQLTEVYEWVQTGALPARMQEASETEEEGR